MIYCRNFLNKKKFQEQELYAYRLQCLPTAKLEVQVSILQKENCSLCQIISSLQTEIYGARLVAKYLDKELAGRYII